MVNKYLIQMTLQAQLLQFLKYYLLWGLVVLFVVGVVMGIKFITASPEEQGKIKGQLIGLAISAVVILEHIQFGN